ncbi:solute carrier family 23 protein [Anaerosoma tenue]|uniref:solute carrier family 23 protein n=1 Tax=Anaerosoma tenue TaxID=2933588 RepID=UPI002260BF84|nr:solute carrier family 23 protein [Anaerosoma tenue]MCK8114263.1 NCS2 family nucleobase:cation symporter [Anaerosoma tenue]
MAQRTIQTDEKLPVLQAIPLALQHLMAMFGATVLVPILTGLDPSLAIMTSGAGTILYLILTRNKIPSYLGSSFAFIGPIAAVAATKGIPEALGGLVVGGLLYVVVALIIKAFGTGWLNKVLPPALVGAVVIVIGLGLAGVAVGMATNGGGDAFDLKNLIVALVTLGAAIAFSSYFKGFLSTIPVLLGIVVGYVFAAFMGMVDFQPVIDAAWIGLPTLVFPKFDVGAILIIAPVALVVIIEHIGHLLVVNEIVGKDFTPMLPESLAGDGLATALSAMVGGTPSTTYAENIGVMAVTKVYATQIFWYAGAFAFVIGGFVPKLKFLIQSIPVPVMGGISLLLFGLIASSGLRMLVESGIDYSHSRNLILSSVVLVVGIGMEATGTTIPIGEYVLPGMATATFLGILLNLVLPKESKGLAVDSPDFSAEWQEEAAEA